MSSAQPHERLDALLHVIASKHQIGVARLENRVNALQARSRGLVSKAMAARLIAAKMALREQLELFLAKSARHISGPDVRDALAVAQKGAAHGRLSTFGYWSYPNDKPADIAAEYIKAIDIIAEAKLNASISIKVDQLKFDRDLLNPVFRRAKECNVRVHFDSQAYETADATLAMLEEAHTMGTDVSASISSRWQRSLQDAERLIALGIPMRIVKGQGDDPTNRRIDPRASFVALVKACAGRASHIGVATHDRRAAEPALDTLKAAGTPCVLEQLVSLPRLDFLADRRGIPVQIYVAHGRFGLPYALAEAIRRPAVVGWILRDLVVRHRTR